MSEFDSTHHKMVKNVLKSISVYGIGSLFSPGAMGLVGSSGNVGIYNQGGYICITSLVQWLPRFVIKIGLELILIPTCCTRGHQGSPEVTSASANHVKQKRHEKTWRRRGVIYHEASFCCHEGRKLLRGGEAENGTPFVIQGPDKAAIYAKHWAKQCLYGSGSLTHTLNELLNYWMNEWINEWMNE